MISRRLWREAKLSGQKDYQIAQAANLHPTTYSKIISGAIKVKPGDVRVIAIGQALGLTEDQCFQDVD